jgi:HAE1 family hydrophobic/amphiphilic exporter-1
MIMASQFESLVHPFTIMFSVPLSLIGAIIGLNLSGELISLTAMIGIIMLAGIVVNNAIILIDYINILRARGQPRNEAIINAGLTRLRPILMTTLTTVLGMIPLALGLGTGAELYRPLAIVVVCGLSFSTILTLVFIPAIYCLFDDLTELAGLISFRISMLLNR